MRIASIAVVALLGFLVLRLRMKRGAGMAEDDPKCADFKPKPWQFGDGQGWLYKPGAGYGWCGYQIARVNPGTGQVIGRTGAPQFVVGAEANRVVSGGGNGAGAEDDTTSDFQEGFSQGWTWVADYIKDWLS